MPTETHDLDLAGLRLSPGEGRRLQLATRVEALRFGGERYVAQPALVPLTLDVSRTVGHGYALRLRLRTALVGPCVRCLKEARRAIEVDAREVDRFTEAGRHAPSARIPVSASGEELSSPYVREEVLDLSAWARDAFALAAPTQVLCREDCAGLCPVCAVDLNDLDPTGPRHAHERPPDPRWAKLRELKLD
jgi:uncharacterized protein